MIEKLQFIKWCTRGLLAFLAAIPLAWYNFIGNLFNKFAKELRDSTGLTLVIWGLITLTAVMISLFCYRMATIGSVCCTSASISHANLIIGSTLGISVSILIVASISALYAAFKEDQQRFIDGLKSNFDNQ
jgi:hypothetical protein